MLAGILAVALRASPDEVTIAWEAPAGCPDAAYVRGRIAEQLRGVEVEAARVRARVSAPEGVGGPWRLSLAIGDEGRRELEGESCEALADAAAVMVAISLNAAVPDEGLGIPEPPVDEARDVAPVEDDAEGEGETAAIERAPVEPDAGAPEVDDAEEPGVRSEPPEPSTRPRGRPSALLGVATGGHGVGLPAPGAWLGGRAGVRWGPIVVAASGSHSFRRERTVLEDIAASYQLSTGGLELCGVLGRGRAPVALEAFACAEVEAGRVRAEGLRAVAARVQRHPWLGVGGGAGALWVARPWLAAGLRVDVVAPLLGRQFVIGEASAGAIGRVDVRGGVVVEFRAPGIGAAR